MGLSVERALGMQAMLVIIDGNWQHVCFSLTRHRMEWRCIYMAAFAGIWFYSV
jgi:hypothetical protein